MTNSRVYGAENEWAFSGTVQAKSHKWYDFNNPYYNSSSSGSHVVNLRKTFNTSFDVQTENLTGFQNGSYYDFALTYKSSDIKLTTSYATLHSYNISSCFLWVRLADGDFLCLGKLVENKTYEFSLPALKDSGTLNFILSNSNSSASADNVCSIDASINRTESDNVAYIDIWYDKILTFDLKYKLHVDKTVQEEIRDEIKKGNELQKEQNETSKGILGKITEFFASFFENLKGLFVPEDGYFSDFFTRLNDFFSEKLGMLYAPIDMFITFLNTIKDASSTDSGITFPELAWDGTVIIPETKFSFSTITKDFPDLQEKIYFVTDVILVGAVLWLLQVKLKEVLEN